MSVRIPIPVFGNLRIKDRNILISTSDERDGTKLWPCSLLLAEYIAEIQFGHLCEVGSGLGIPIMFAKATKKTIVENDAIVLQRLNENLKDNQVIAHILDSAWSTANGVYDSIIGSEVLYYAYDPQGLLSFIDRTWNRSGMCFFVNSMLYVQKEWEAGLTAIGATFKLSQIGEAYLWEIKSE